MSKYRKNNKVINIETKSEICSLLDKNRYRALKKQGIRKISFSLKSLSVEENEQLSKRINGYYSSCGCREGTIAFLITTVVYSVYLIFLYERNISYVELIFGFLLLILAMAIGKVVGKILGRFRLFNELKSIQSKI